MLATRSCDLAWIENGVAPRRFTLVVVPVLAAWVPEPHGRVSMPVPEPMCLVLVVGSGASAGARVA